MLLSLLLSVFMTLSVDAVSFWDSVLSCYERLCDACIENRDSKSIADIKGELDLLLKKPVGKMNDAQKKRFDDIRRRYNSVEHGSFTKGRVDTVVIVKKVPVEKVREIEHVVVYDTVKVQNNISTVVVEHRYSRKDTSVVIHTLQPSRETLDGSGSKHLGWFIGAAFGLYPHFSAGLTTGVGNTAGFYIKGRSNFRSIRSEGSADTGKGSFWGSGESAFTRHLLCMGGWFTLYKGLRLNVGAGYGQYCRFLQDTSGKWLEDSGCSYRGFAADLGLAYKWGRVLLFAGASSSGFKYYDAEAGVAICFGM